MAASAAQPLRPGTDAVDRALYLKNGSMSANKFLTILTVLATSGCAGWHLFPQDVVSSSRQEIVASDQSEVHQFERESASQFNEQARISYQRAIIAKVKENWAPPAEPAPNISCNIRVEQFTDGEIISAQVVDTCGSPAVDGSIIDAVYQASPLPIPSDPNLFERELQFPFVTP